MEIQNKSAINMDSNQDQEYTSGQSEVPVPLPPGFRSIRQIKDMPNDQVQKGTFVSVIGFLKDYQSPVETRGTGKYQVIGPFIFIYLTIARLQMHVGSS